ncbi:ScyD/ScyE family protein [Cellulomonas sp. JH27-2]|uniref:ScyD/ScyE family protein n=1 Tax=Cellulomonas sp. JH27-2 TaxID=2774139 RepID=UPI00177E7CD5|nr:ScyD/ScyE family protein [Cellulomonas sp. JH27-2]MBD8059295.1 ScyD/ScyE family protein [Cellulomonas sp. JH27-2]
MRDVRAGLRAGVVALVAAAGLVAAGSAPASATQHADRGPHFGHGSVWSKGWHPAKHRPTAGTPTVVASDLAGPLTFAVGARSLYVGQAFAGIVTKHSKNADPVVVGAAVPGADAAAVDVAPGVLTWAERGGDQESVTSSVLHRQTRDGVANIDLLAYETSNNPDQGNKYGLRGLDDACLAQVPAMFQPYTGLVDSHAYGSVNVGRTTYVADAGANAILKVDRTGKVSTVAVLKPVPVTITAEAAAAFGLPDCVVGHDYAFEPVPTDVEVGPGGALFVTLLPGGPEDGSLGALGKLVKVNPSSGKVTTIATGFAGATGLAVGRGGTVFVAELYGNQVSSVDCRGKVRVLTSLEQPAGLEWANGKLYASTGVFGAGQIVSMTVR